MEKTIWKFELQNNDFQAIEMPKDAEILSIQPQNNKVCIWAKVDPDNEKESRAFQIIGTGNPVSDKPKKYLGTFQIYEGQLVFHLFELL